MLHDFSEKISFFITKNEFIYHRYYVNSIRTRPSIGKVTVAVIVIVVIIIGALGGYYYYLSTLPKPVTMEILVDSGSETEQYLTMVANDFMKLHPNVHIHIEPVGFG
ncbi:MAG: hypothetical protein ACP5LW_01240 [Nitrososphaeria archaeon]